MRILFLGDIMGRPGRMAAISRMGRLKDELGLDGVLGNVENVSGGIGLTPENALELKQAGLDIMTSGNHIWKHKEIVPFIEKTPWLLRPANYPPGTPGAGWGVFDLGAFKLGVLNLQGRVFMRQLDCPFRTAKEIVQEISRQTGNILVDFHAEATSEKKALLHFLDGEVSGVLGSHTHVQTNDPLVTQSGTGFISDIGMCGPHDSVIGMDPDSMLDGFLRQLPQKFSVAKGPVRLEGVLLEIDPESGKTLQLQAWQEANHSV